MLAQHFPPPESLKSTPFGLASQATTFRRVATTKRATSKFAQRGLDALRFGIGSMFVVGPMMERSVKRDLH